MGVIESIQRGHLHLGRVPQARRDWQSDRHLFHPAERQPGLEIGQVRVGDALYPAKTEKIPRQKIGKLGQIKSYLTLT